MAPPLKLISATDTQYSEAVLKSMNEQRVHGLFCDVTIIIQDKKFRAHKTILSASSTYFYQLFTVAGQVIELNFIRAEIFEEILNYIYTSKIYRVRSDMLEEKNPNTRDVVCCKAPCYRLSKPQFTQQQPPAQSRRQPQQLVLPCQSLLRKCSHDSSRVKQLDPRTAGCLSACGKQRHNGSPQEAHLHFVSARRFQNTRSHMATPLKPLDKTPMSPKASPNRKRPKAELEDHYELIMDGKTFYVCIVCKRPYVCLTSLRRHFNTHSWEKKYPCRYCNKVFALAEYRTKHEIHHTGERRYQCLVVIGSSSAAQRPRTCSS
uniref:Uncharacterized protein n=1 Tax=Mola mola TaxID=94237 RepID=A0A3Q3W161_MOLML